MEEAKTLYGPRKLGEEAFAAQQARQKLSSRGATVYGSRKQDPSPGAPGTPAPGNRADNPYTLYADQSGDNYLSIDELKKRLAEKPDDLDLAIQAELDMTEPRKGAVRHFIELEEKAGTPREALLKILKAHL